MPTKRETEDREAGVGQGNDGRPIATPGVMGGAALIGAGAGALVGGPLLALVGAGAGAAVCLREDKVSK